MYKVHQYRINIDFELCSLPFSVIKFMDICLFGFEFIGDGRNNI